MRQKLEILWKHALLFIASLLLPSFYSMNHAKAQDQMAVAPPDQYVDDLFPAEISGIPIQNFLQSNSYLKVLEQAVMAHETTLGACRTPTFKGRVNFAAPHIPRAFPDAGVVPQWLEIVEIEGCEEPFERFVLVGVVDNAPAFHPLLAGNALSLLDMVVEKDVLTTLLASEREHSLASGCLETDNIRIHDTKLLSHKQEEDTLYWNEAWRISDCKAQKTLTIEFKTNPSTGTHFTIHQPQKPKTAIKTDASQGKVAR